MIAKLLFVPVKTASSMVAGVIAARTFEHAWKLVDVREPPDPARRQVRWGTLVVGLALEGAIFRMVRGSVDHASRELFARVTGSWPGEEQPGTAGPS
jgi:hypothetical protein